MLWRSDVTSLAFLCHAAGIFVPPCWHSTESAKSLDCDLEEAPESSTKTFGGHYIFCTSMCLFVLEAQATLVGGDEDGTLC